jgi:hypothetical protein
VRGDLAAASECNCSMCSKKGFIHLIVPTTDFEIVEGKDALASYRFNTGIAQHTFCKTCGIHPFYVPRSDPERVDVNVRCLDGVDLSLIHPTPFDGKNWEAAMQGHLPWRDGR